MPTCQLTTNPTDGLEITWEVEYVVSPLIAATHEQPAEGGIDIDSDPTPVAIIHYPDQGDSRTEDVRNNPTKQGVIAHLFPAPSDEDCWEAAGIHAYESTEDTRW